MGAQWQSALYYLGALNTLKEHDFESITVSQSLSFSLVLPCSPSLSLSHFAAKLNKELRCV